MAFKKSWASTFLFLLIACGLVPNPIHPSKVAKRRSGADQTDRRLFFFSQKMMGLVSKGSYPNVPKPFRCRNCCNFTWMVWVRRKVFFPECVRFHTGERKPLLQRVGRWLHDFKLHLEDHHMLSYIFAYRCLFLTQLESWIWLFSKENFRHQQILLMEEIRLTIW